MTGFFSALREDLSNRRLLPVFILLGVALLGALTYAVTGGSSPSGTRHITRPTLRGGTQSAGISVSAAPVNSTRALAENANGTSVQQGGPTRDPFAGLRSAAKTSSGSGASGGGTTSPSSSTTTAQAPAPAAPAQPPKTVYQATVLFGVAPAGQPAAISSLTPYEDIPRLTPLPSAKNPVVVFAGVTATGNSAAFTVVGEVILRGSAVCVPNSSQCLTIQLNAGQSEQLEYIPPSGPAVTYEIQLISISASKATASAARRVFARESKAGRELLRRAGLEVVPGLRYSFEQGVLVHTGNSSSSRKTHLVPHPGQGH